MFAAVHEEGRGVMIEVDGGGVEEMGEGNVIGIGVGGGGRRVVTGHRNPNRYEVRGGEVKTIGVDGNPMCVAIGMILGSCLHTRTRGRNALLPRYW